jgi:hypothetical protein
VQHCEILLNLIHDTRVELIAKDTEAIENEVNEETMTTQLQSDQMKRSISDDPVSQNVEEI